MNSKYKRRAYAKLLPATPCTVEMHEKVIELATKEQMSLAEISRQALTLFLSTIDSDLSIGKQTISIKDVSHE